MITWGLGLLIGSKEDLVHFQAFAVFPLYAEHLFYLY